MPLGPVQRLAESRTHNSIHKDAAVESTATPRSSIAPALLTQILAVEPTIDTLLRIVPSPRITPPRMKFNLLLVVCVHQSFPVANPNRSTSQVHRLHPARMSSQAVMPDGVLGRQ
jgi:hypothetical protein